MSLHLVEYSYKISESASTILELDPTDTADARELFAVQAIKEMFDDISDIEILSIKEKIYE